MMIKVIKTYWYCKENKFNQNMQLFVLLDEKTISLWKNRQRD